MWRLDMDNPFRILKNSKKLHHMVALSKENLDAHEYMYSSQPSFAENVNSLLHKEFTFTLFYCKKKKKKKFFYSFNYVHSRMGFISWTVGRVPNNCVLDSLVF
jgi:hypothetical protein